MHKDHSRILAALLLAVASLPLGAQTCSPNIRESTSASQFQVNADGTVFDRRTGLMWKQCAEGLGGADCATGSPVDVDWAGALSRAAASAFAGHRDWRLPNLKELASLLEEKCEAPAINSAVFPGTPLQGLFWSSTPVAGVGDKARYFDFYSGGYGVYFKDGSGPSHVRLVRGGQ